MLNRNEEQFPQRLQRQRNSRPAATYLFASILGLAGISALVGPGMAQSKSGPTDLNSERLKYEEDVSAALQPVQKKYVARLKVLQKVLIKNGDKIGAAAVEAELEKMGTAMAQQMRYPIEGKWVVKYQNTATRTYHIHADGTVEFLEANLAGRFTKEGDNVLVDFGDDKLERFYWNTVLVVEHYNPKSTYGTEAAQTTGFAQKAP